MGLFNLREENVGLFYVPETSKTNWFKLNVEEILCQNQVHSIEGEQTRNNPGFYWTEIAVEEKLNNVFSSCTLSNILHFTFYNITFHNVAFYNDLIRLMFRCSRDTMTPASPMEDSVEIRFPLKSYPWTRLFC